jgi:hypothetical protein
VGREKLVLRSSKKGLAPELIFFGDMAPPNPRAAAADPKMFVDPSFVQDLESFGFIKQLYKK